MITAEELLEYRRHERGPRQKARFGGEFFELSPEGSIGREILALFQRDQYTGQPKGILAVSLPRGIEYFHGDARFLDGIAELEPTLHNTARILRPGGWFIFSIIHPCYNPPPSGEMATPEGWVRTVRGYWDEGYWRSDTRTGPPGKVGSYHRTLSTYINALTDAGLVLERLCEPRATGISAEQRPVWAEVPAFLIARCRKAIQAEVQNTL